MRALYCQNFSENSTVELTKEQLHHLRNVLRLKEGQDVLLLNGKGNQAQAKVVELQKRSGRVEVKDVSFTERTSDTELCLGVTKKENIEEVVKSAQMCGVKKLSLVQTERSPYTFKMNDRVQIIAISALEQSNSPYLLEIDHFDSLRNYLQVSQTSNLHSYLCDWGFDNIKEPQSLRGKGITLFIGPEGGFSPEEKELILNERKAQGLSFQTPILRSTHAVIYALGFLEAHKHLP